jgi:hypothetical protein
MKHCCEEMTQHLASKDVAINFLAKFREYAISYRHDERTFQTIRFCPWCGSRLPNSLRVAWFEKIHALGFEPEDPGIPSIFQSEEWYSQNAT